MSNSKLKPLTINLKELNEFRDTETLLYARCFTGKELRLTCHGGIQVCKDGKILYQSTQPYPAVEFFNSL